MYHLVTHAFFKALLFLGAGSVIHALHHEQDIWKMGGLRNGLPVTYWTFLVGTLALVRGAAPERFLLQGRYPGRGGNPTRSLWSGPGGRCAHHVLHVPTRFRRSSR
jgi:hypothetical protein